jgi:hypothetical protein
LVVPQAYTSWGPTKLPEVVLLRLPGKVWFGKAIFNVSTSACGFPTGLDRLELCRLMVQFPAQMGDACPSTPVAFEYPDETLYNSTLPELSQAK